MFKQNPNILTILSFLLMLLVLPSEQVCTQERCCLSTQTCTSSYCTQKNSETWVSTLSYTNYGYTKLVLSNNSCKPCPYNCKVCSSQTTCTSCADGFYMDSNTSKCLLCSDKCLTCTVVNQITKCSICQTGSYLDSTTLTCKSCPQGSSSCSSQTAIISCTTGYVKSSNSLYCLSCPSNCDSCSTSNTVCSSCSTGYYLNNSQCSVCSLNNCLACMKVGSNVYCSQCKSGYVLQAGVCNSCPSNCGSCSNTTKCTTCNNGYYVSSGSCFVVSTTISNCITYSATSTCSVCSSGYYLTNNLCYPCSLLCNQCIGNHFGLCTNCNSNANLFNEMCLVNNFPSSSTYQLFYSFPQSSYLLNSGSLYCSNLFASSNSISLNLNNLQGYKINVQWKIFSIQATSSYNVELANTYATTISTSSTANPSYAYCSSNSTQKYYLSSATTLFSTVATSNTLTFKSNGSTNLALQQVVILVYRCNSLCVQCSQTLCTQCMMTTLYTQDAYCVYTCSNGYYIYENSSSTTNPKQCLSNCPLGTYTLTTNASCVSCKSPCLTCLSQSFCLSCVANYFLASDNTCLQACPYKYYGQIQTQTCQQCVGKCLQCLSQAQCLSCISGFLQTSSLTCESDCTFSTIGLNGYYADLTTLKCETCNSNCLNCQYESTYCVQCQSSLFLYENACLINCPDKFYAPSGTNVCSGCEYPCKNCITSSIFCTSCIEGYLYNNSCINSCYTGFYEDNVNRVCLPCNSGCQQCYGSSNYCLSCVNPYYYYDYSCSLSCPNGYYNSTADLICYSCTNPCLTCLNQTFCLSCKQNFLFNGSCVSSGQCGAGYFANILTLKCQICASPCLTCQYASNYCTSCDISNSFGLIYLQNFTCVASCSSVYFFSSVSSTSASCNSCQEPCLTCISQSLCLSCISGYKYSNNVCSSTCSIGTYFDSSILDCNNCSSNCSICTNKLFCQTCKTGFYINSISTTQNQCLSSCNSGYYSQSFSASCQKCIYPCDSCTSSIDCLSCISGVLYQNRCISSCPDSTYLSIATSTCITCSSNCMTCSSDPTYCNSCYDGYYLDSLSNICVTTCPSLYYGQSLTKSCLQCASTCTKCLNTTYCTACITNTTYLNLATNMCLKYCPVGKYGSNSTQNCETCNLKCSSCQYSASNCLTCSIGYFFTRITATQADCLSTCASGYYNQSDNCYVCVFPCKTCSNSISCLTCADGTFYHQSSGSCLLACPSSTFYDFTNYICQPCSSPCSTCSNSTYCLGCENSLYLYKGMCITNCPSKYYPDASGICNRCYGLCATCTSKYYCLTCIAGYEYSGYCYSSCPLGTFANMTSGICQACSLPCTQCILTSTYCKKCNGGLFVYKGACSAACPDGTYESNSQCLACSFPCVKCSSANTCDQCLGGYLLYMNISCISDVEKCPNDFYKMDAKYCVPKTWCPSNYFIDQDSKTCSASCNITKYTDNSTKMCLTSCSSGQYAGLNLFCEDYYPNVPSSLLGMSVITFIQSSYVYIIIQFNQTVIWQSIASDMYTISQTQILSDSRLLMQLTASSLPAYTLDISNPTELQLNLSTLPSRFNLTLPAYMVKSASTNYPLQNPTITVISPEFTKYSYQQIYSGSIMGQLSQGISWFILLLSLFFLFQNRLSDLYILWDTVQLLYLLVFLDIQYPPNLNQFFLGLKYTHLYFLPSIFSISTTRDVSDTPFYAYSFDNNFMRNTGHEALLLLVVLIIFILLKIGQLMIKKVQKVKQIVKQYPSIKGFIYKGILRYRWHHVSDVVFLTYSNIMLFAFASVYFMSQNKESSGSNALAIIFCVAYIAFCLFFGYKLYKHYPNISRGKLSNNLKCFYRGIQKDNKFGVAFVLIRYIRKLVYALVISIFSKSPMYAVPILMFTSVLMALFLFINLPFKKKLSNIITITAQITLSFMYIFIVLIHFNDSYFDTFMKQMFGWICCIILAFIIFALIYEVFCKTMFYLQPQQNPNQQKKKIEDMNQDYIRKKAGEFFDSVFPKLRQRLNLSDDSDDQLYHYEDGDSQNSQNNELRQRDLDIESSSQSDQFRHYDNNSDSQVTDQKSKQKLQAPKFLVRCVKELQ